MVRHSLPLEPHIQLYINLVPPATNGRLFQLKHTKNHEQYQQLQRRRPRYVMSFPFASSDIFLNHLAASTRESHIPETQAHREREGQGGAYGQQQGIIPDDVNQGYAQPGVNQGQNQPGVNQGFTQPTAGNTGFQGPGTGVGTGFGNNAAAGTGAPAPAAMSERANEPHSRGHQHGQGVGATSTTTGSTKAHMGDKVLGTFRFQISRRLSSLLTDCQVLPKLLSVVRSTTPLWNRLVWSAKRLAMPSIAPMMLTPVCQPLVIGHCNKTLLLAVCLHNKVSITRTPASLVLVVLAGHTRFI